MSKERKKAEKIFMNWVAVCFCEDCRKLGKSIKVELLNKMAEALTEARNEGIEEAAKVSEIHSKTWIPIARAIRQLKEPSDG